MKRGFTLVEMLIVVVVLVTLMTMTFRLSSLGGDSARRNQTIARLQRLENCLSGYYAAFGTYPPVSLYASRNPWIKLEGDRMQDENGTENRAIFHWDAEKFRAGTYQKEEADAWDQVEAACRAQPVECCFPFANDYSDFVEGKSEQVIDYIDSLDEGARKTHLKEKFGSGFSGGSKQYLGALGRHDKWRKTQVFKFGLMSYLLPRYIVMMGADEDFYRDFDQWNDNNTLPCDALTGLQFGGWDDVCDYVTGDNKTDYARVANIPSQVVCSRWMANLEGMVNSQHGSLTVFGISLSSGENTFNPDTLNVYFKGDGGGGDRYILDSCTVWDGWDLDFFYYSPAPYQNYVLWSAGKNGRTFPPWIAREELSSDENKCVGAWTEDDIVSMSH